MSLVFPQPKIGRIVKEQTLFTRFSVEKKNLKLKKFNKNFFFVKTIEKVIRLQTALC